VNAGTAWRSASYSDTAWKSGPAQLGYGDGDERTIVSYGPDANNKYTTTYFRRTFSVANPSQVTALTLNLLRDDGAIVYLNGQEVYRTNMPTGTIASTTPATTAIGGADESTWYTANISPSLLLSGNNLLAVEVHQANGTSTDISFDLSLIGQVASTTLAAAAALDPYQVTPPEAMQGSFSDVPFSHNRGQTATPLLATNNTDHDVANSESFVMRPFSSPVARRSDSVAVSRRALDRLLDTNFLDELQDLAIGA